MFITIDPYYNSQFYNESLEALKNNKTEFTEYICIKTPYNWFLNLPREPIMVNFDSIIPSEKKLLVSKVIALRENEEYFLQRRNDDTGVGILKYIENEPMQESRKSDYSVFFNVSNKEELMKISKQFPDKIWYLGKYFNNTLKVCLCNNSMIKNYINTSQILLEKTKEHSLPGSFEADFNFRVLKSKDFIVKYTETAYALNGIIIRPKISINPSKTIL